jgi:hypothetical protein
VHRDLAQQPADPPEAIHLPRAQLDDPQTDIDSFVLRACCADDHDEGATYSCLRPDTAAMWPKS